LALSNSKVASIEEGRGIKEVFVILFDIPEAQTLRG